MNRLLSLHGGVPAPSRPIRFALAQKGFRPFFLFPSVFATLIVQLWLLVLSVVVAPGPYLDLVAWHAHEMVFGYAVAVIAGFLLTAVANWTQRETLTGTPLLALAALWAFGRVAMLAPALFPRGLVAAIDLAFLPLLALALARPLVATGNRRNFVMIAILAVLSAANLAVHLEALGVLAPGAARHASLVGVDVIVFLMLVIAGRILPMFTRNTTKATAPSSPLLERLTVAGGIVLVAVDAVRGDSGASRVAAGALGVIAIARAARWATPHTLRHPLLWILHAGYAWIPIGLLLRATSMPSALHALTAGAIGSLTIGMMARVTLGHTGRPLAASSATAWSFAAITGAALARVAGPLVTTRYHDVLTCAGILWTAAFVLYLAGNAAALVAPRVDGKAG
jgi:uncharacterized protein involved in response to NO